MGVLLACCQCARAASWEQSDTEAVRAVARGDVEQVKRLFADPKRLAPIEENVLALQDVYVKGAESGSVPLLKYFDSMGWLSRLKAAGKDSVGNVVLVAAMRGKIAVLDYLASQQVDLAAADNYLGYTALHAAADQGRVETVRHLCELGLRPDARNHWGKTVLEVAEKDLQVTERGGPKETAKYKESLQQIVAYLKEKGPDGCTPKKIPPVTK